MVVDPSHFHVRALEERFQQLKTAIEKTHNAFGAGNTLEQRKAAANGIASASKSMMDMLAVPHHPKWLPAIRTAAETFAHSGDGGHAGALLRQLFTLSPSIAPIFPTAEEVEVNEYDFDEIFGRLRDQYELTDLFDKLVDEITAIIVTGDIDSVVALAALQKIADALKANRTGSQSSMQAAFDYSRFGLHTMHAYLKRVPGVAPIYEGVEKTVAEADAKLKAANDAMRDEAIRRLIEALPKLEKLAQFVEQHQLSPQADPPKISNEIDGEFTVQPNKPNAIGGTTITPITEDKQNVS